MKKTQTIICNNSYKCDKKIFYSKEDKCWVAVANVGNVKHGISAFGDSDIEALVQLNISLDLYSRLDDIVRGNLNG